MITVFRFLINFFKCSAAVVKMARCVMVTGLVCLICGPIVLFTGCEKKSDSITMQQSPNGKIVFSSQLISLEIEPTTQINIHYLQQQNNLSLLVPADPAGIVPHYLIVNGTAVNRFLIEPEKTKFSSLMTDFGPGRQIVVISRANGPARSVIQKDLIITLLDRYPEVILSRAVFRIVEAAQPVVVNQIISDAFQLDRKMVAPEELSHNFWNFSGFGKSLGGKHGNTRVNVLPVTGDMDIENDSEEISGIPLVDIWAPEMGVAIASIEKRAKILKMPVQVDENGLVNISIREEPQVKLQKGESIAAVQTAIILHSLDYYNPLHCYSKLMADQGITSKPCPDFGYDPFWCNWGYRTEWSLDHGLDRLDEFRALGIKAITIDDGWFDEYGDWYASPRRFPGGDRQLKEWVDKIHAAGLKAVFWWVPGIGGPRVEKEHPDWMILNKSGEKVSIHWKNSAMLCPSLPKVIEYHRKLTEKFITEYGFDGFKMDGIYIAPRCYNSAHHHSSPDESYEDYEEIFKAIYETAMQLKPDGDFILGMCPCGSLCSPYYLQWGNRPVAADPPQRSITTRHRVKAYKALLGPKSSVDNDFHERYNDYFPVEFGAGGLMTTKYTHLSAYEISQFKKWYGIFNRYHINSGEYLNLYDVAWDDPEAYVVRKDGNYFYTFLKPGINGPENVPWYENEVDIREKMLRDFDTNLEKLPLWEGNVELRGLEKRDYKVFNLETGEELGTVSGPETKLQIQFRDHLIVIAEPI